MSLELACCMVFIYTINMISKAGAEVVRTITSFSNDDFSSFMNSTKETRLLRNKEVKIELSQLIIQIYKLSLTAFRKKKHARVVKVKHDLLHIVSQVNQSKTNH